MKLVLDTDIVVAAFRSPTGGSAELLRLAQLGQCNLVVSNALLLEYESVLTRPEHLGEGDREISDAAALIDIIAAIADHVPIDFAWRPQLRDPDDELVLDTAVNARADAIVTFNRRDFGTAPKRFGIDCLLPGQALEKLR